METFPIYFDWSITSVAKLFGQPWQNSEKCNDKNDAYNKHVATSQLLTNSDPHIEPPCPVQIKLCNTHSHSPLPALPFSPSSSSTSSSLLMVADCSVFWNFLCLVKTVKNMMVLLSLLSCHQEVWNRCWFTLQGVFPWMQFLYYKNFKDIICFYLLILTIKWHGMDVWN